MSLSTPVAFIIFNRPDLTQIVFNEIRKAQPKQLFVIADGARTPEEWKKCRAARDVIKQVDWDCAVLYNYSVVNLGCRDRVSSGITWVFEQVEEAIILEDDCLPDPSFFSFCETLLDYYRNDKRVMVISGNNFQNGINRTEYSYYFSRYNHCWGWATWRRAWQYWSFDPEKWIQFKQQSLMDYIFDESVEAKYWTNIFDQVFLQGKPNTWDYPWTFACWNQGGLTILPNQNLVSNIGFGMDATHTQQVNKLVSCLPIYEIKSIQHPSFIVRHKEADMFTFKTIFSHQYKRKIQDKLKEKILRTIKT